MAQNKNLDEIENSIKNRHRRAEGFAHLGHWQYSIESKVLNSSDEMNRIYGYDPIIYQLTMETKMFYSGHNKLS